MARDRDTNQMIQVFKNISSFQTYLIRFSLLIQQNYSLGLIVVMDYFDELPAGYPLDFPHPKAALLDSTSQEEKHRPKKITEDDFFYESNECAQLRYISEVLPYEDEEDSFMNIVDNLIRSHVEIGNDDKPAPPKKSKKNSNAIKKMGRIILNNLDKYQIPNTRNLGVENMMKKLKDRFVGKKSKSMVDGFNTYHLQALFSVEDDHISKFNMKTTRSIFTKLLRKEVLTSYQIKGDGKLLYLNTLKCSSLRFMNKRLANRLQTSQNQQ